MAVLVRMRSADSATTIDAHGTRVSGYRQDTPIFRVDYGNRGFCKQPEVLTT